MRRIKQQQGDKHMRNRKQLAMGLTLAMALTAATHAVEETNYALNSTVIARPAGGWELEGLETVADGKCEQRWGTYSPCEIELHFPYDRPVTINKVRITIGPETWAPPQQYRGEVQSWDGQAWVTLQAFDQKGAGNRPMEWDGFEVTTSGLRLVVHESTWRSAGGGGGGDVIVFEIEAFGPKSEAKPLDASERMRIEPQGMRDPDIPYADRRIFNLGEPAVVSVSLDGADLPQGDYELRCDIRDWQLNKIATLPARPAKTGAKTEATFQWKAGEQGPYVMDVSLWKDGSLVGLERELLGVRDDKLFETGRIEPLPAPAGLKRKSYDELVGPGHMLFSVGDVAHVNMPAFERTAREIKAAGYDCIKAWQGWRSLEPLPGVYSFKRIDDIFGYALKYDLGVGVWFGFHDQAGATPVWLRDEVQLYHHGRRDSVVPGRYYGSMHVANHGEKARAHRPRLAQLLAARYGKHPALVCWMPNQISIEAGLNEQPEYRLDYSRWAMFEFREFLTEYKGWTLEQVAERWGVHFNHWDEVRPPRPYFELTGDIVNAYVIDTRPIWLDWMEYRDWGQTRAIADGVDALRAASPNVPMTLWSDMGYGTAHYLPYLSENRVSVAFCAMGHGNGVQIPKHAMFARRFGVPYRTEYHALMPPSVGHWNGGIYDQLAMEARMFDWIGPIPRSPAMTHSVGPAFYKTGRVKEMLDELSWAKRPAGEVGYLWSMLATQIQGKGGNWAVDIETWNRMMAVGQYTQDRHRWVLQGRLCGRGPDDPCRRCGEGGRLCAQRRPPGHDLGDRSVRAAGDRRQGQPGDPGETDAAARRVLPAPRADLSAAQGAGLQQSGRPARDEARRRGGAEQRRRCPRLVQPRRGQRRAGASRHAEGDRGASGARRNGRHLAAVLRTAGPAGRTGSATSPWKRCGSSAKACSARPAARKSAKHPPRRSTRCAVPCGNCWRTSTPGPVPRPTWSVPKKSSATTAATATRTTPCS
jgi:hypothetical protein